ncbi:MAG: hypothetical protein ACP5NI_01525, partial [Acetobacteraceae bacterium]
STERFHSEGFTRFFQTIRNELDNEYFQEVSAQLEALRFRRGVVATARLAWASLPTERTGRGRGVWLTGLGLIAAEKAEREEEESMERMMRRIGEDTVNAPRDCGTARDISILLRNGCASTLRLQF